MFGCREKFRDCMHGILHMEQNFKGEYSSLLFLCVPLLIQGSVCLLLLLFFFVVFFFVQGNTSVSKQSKELQKCFSTVQNHSSCSLTSRITAAQRRSGGHTAPLRACIDKCVLQSLLPLVALHLNPAQRHNPKPFPFKGESD